MELEGKVALVTGASSGLGKSISLALAGQGVKVGLLARRKEKLEETEREIEQIGGTGLVVPADVAQEADVSGAVERVVAEYRRLDILVNNAGLGIFKEVHEMAAEEWDRHINVMLRGAFLASKCSLPHLYARQSGHVINISSLWAKRFCGMCSAYTAAKFGLRGFTQSLREEARVRNVKVTNIMPGTVDTPFFDNAGWETDLSKALQPEDIAESVLFVLSLPDRAVVEEIVLQAIRPDQCTC